MKRKTVLMMTTGILTLAMLAGCGKTAEQGAASGVDAGEQTKEQTEQIVETAEAEEEERLSPFDADLALYDPILQTLTKDSYFAFADMSKDHDAMLVATPDVIYDNGDGTTAASEASVYGIDQNGEPKWYGYVAGGGTATPLAAIDGTLFYGGHDYMNKVHIDEASSEMITEEGEFFDEYEKAVTLAFFPMPEGVGLDVNIDEGDAMGMGPTDFVQDQSGRLEFKDYDDLISCLKSGQGYAKIKLEGSDEEVLAMTEKLNADGTTSEAVLYTMKDGAPWQMGYVTGTTEQDLVRLEDGLIYAGDEKNYDVWCITPDGTGLMMRAAVYEDTSSGTATYGGFIRSSNDFDSTEDYTGDADAFAALIKERDSKPAITFTAVK